MVLPCCLHALFITSSSCRFPALWALALWSSVPSPPSLLVPLNLGAVAPLSGPVPLSFLLSLSLAFALALSCSCSVSVFPHLPAVAPADPLPPLTLFPQPPSCGPEDDVQLQLALSLSREEHDKVSVASLLSLWSLPHSGPQYPGLQELPEPGQHRGPSVMCP